MICFPTFIVGLSVVIGFWNTAETTSPLNLDFSQFLNEKFCTSCPATTTFPDSNIALAPANPNNVDEITDFPEPDSPIIAWTSPLYTSNPVFLITNFLRLWSEESLYKILKSSIYAMGVFPLFNFVFSTIIGFIISASLMHLVWHFQ